MDRRLPRINPLRADPTRTAGLRRQWGAALRRRFATLKRAVTALLVKEDALGLADRGSRIVLHQRWRWLTTPQQVQAFRAWLSAQIGDVILPPEGSSEEEQWWNRYVQEGYKRGAARAFDDATRSEKVLAEGAEKLDFYEGSKDQFLRSAFARPVAVEKVKLLAGRVYTELRGVTEDMGTRLARELTDGLVEGLGPREVARNINREIDVGRKRALNIARTETVRAHAEGQLDALEELGVEEVGVMVEWSTSGLGETALGNLSPCDLCAELEGIVLKMEEAHNMIPRHPG